tara:strand:+ start:416 stop:634 length:219 start_codon:yes stop_codon:yes gene_type:complete
MNLILTLPMHDLTELIDLIHPLIVVDHLTVKICPIPDKEVIKVYVPVDQTQQALDVLLTVLDPEDYPEFKMH